MSQLAHKIASQEEARVEFLQNVRPWHLLDQSEPLYHGDYINFHLEAWIDLPLEELNDAAILERCETGIMSARLPSVGLDPFIISMEWSAILEWEPLRVFVRLWIGGTAIVLQNYTDL